MIQDCSFSLQIYWRKYHSAKNSKTFSDRFRLLHKKLAWIYAINKLFCSSHEVTFNSNYSKMTATNKSLHTRHRRSFDFSLQSPQEKRSKFESWEIIIQYTCCQLCLIYILSPRDQTLITQNDSCKFVFHSMAAAKLRTWLEIEFELLKCNRLTLN